MLVTTTEKMRQFQRRFKGKGLAVETKLKEEDKEASDFDSCSALGSKVHCNSRSRMVYMKVIIMYLVAVKQTVLTNYKTMLKKAAKQVTVVLPKSPRKCCKVVTEHAIACGIAVYSAPNSNKKIHHLSQDTEEVVVAFCLQDDIL
jgi:hypothetical protein